MANTGTSRMLVTLDPETHKAIDEFVQSVKHSGNRRYSNVEFVREAIEFHLKHKDLSKVGTLPQAAARKTRKKAA